MQLIRDIYAAGRSAGKPVISFEFFTPKTEEGDRTLFGKTMPALARLGPAYCSVTYGAGGSTRDKTLSMVDRIQRDYSVPAMAHLTCVGSTREEIAGMLAQAKARDIVNILALRGDPPAGSSGFQQIEGGFQFAHELVTLTRNTGGFSIGVAGFPEGHLECKEGKEVDWRRLQAKIGCGADFVITQIFFENTFFYDFRDYLVRKLGVTVPIIPGIIAIQSAAQINRFTALCGATMPAMLRARLDALANDDAGASEFGIEFAARQCADLLRAGVPGLHFYTLNKSVSTARILTSLGLNAPV